MKKGTKENRELTFGLYKEERGQNIGLILRRLEQGHGLKISAQTLHKWKRQERWDERMTDEKEATLDEKMLERLLRLVDRYEQQIERSDRLNDQSTYAYMHLIGATSKLARRVRPERKDPEEMRRLTAEILEREYGIVR